MWGPVTQLGVVIFERPNEGAEASRVVTGSPWIGVVRTQLKINSYPVVGNHQRSRKEKRSYQIRVVYSVVSIPNRGGVLLPAKYLIST